MLRRRLCFPIITAYKTFLVIPSGTCMKGWIRGAGEDVLLRAGGECSGLQPALLPLANAAALAGAVSARAVLPHHAAPRCHPCVLPGAARLCGYPLCEAARHPPRGGPLSLCLFPMLAALPVPRSAPSMMHVPVAAIAQAVPWSVRQALTCTFQYP